MTVWMPKKWLQMVKKWPFLKLKFSGVFFPNWKTQFSIKFVIHAIAFYKIKIETCLTPQNESQHLIFVQDIYVVGKKMTRNGCKLAKRKSCLFFKSPLFTWTKFPQFGLHNTYPLFTWLSVDFLLTIYTNSPYPRICLFIECLLIVKWAGMSEARGVGGGPDLGRSVNAIPTRGSGGQTMPTNCHTPPPQIFRPSDIPDGYQISKKCRSQTFTYSIIFIWNAP